MILDIIAGLISVITAMHGQVDTLAMTETYAKYRMADSCFVETLSYPDSTLVIETVCAPICSSHARIYNKEWEIIRTIAAPYPDASFVEAKIENGKIEWIINDPDNQLTF